MEFMKDYICSLLEKGMRMDGRKFDEFRKDIKIEYGVSSKSAEGSARVTIGDTVVVAGVKMEVEKPYPDIPDEGVLIVGVELLPLSSPEFDPGPPTIQAIELARAVIDRGIRESKAVNFKKLCVKKGEKVWIVLVDGYSINDAGNLADALGLAALAALKDVRFPKYDEEKDVVFYEERIDKGLPIDHLPIPVTVIKIKDKYLVDPTIEEEKAMDARLTVTIIEDGRICAVQKGGNAPLTPEDIDKMIEIAAKKGEELRKLFK